MRVIKAMRDRWVPISRFEVISYVVALTTLVIGTFLIWLLSFVDQHMWGGAPVFAGFMAAAVMATVSLFATYGAISDRDRRRDLANRHRYMK